MTPSRFSKYCIVKKYQRNPPTHLPTHTHFHIYSRFRQKAVAQRPSNNTLHMRVKKTWTCTKNLSGANQKCKKTRSIHREPLSRPFSIYRARNSFLSRGRARDQFIAIPKIQTFVSRAFNLCRPRARTRERERARTSKFSSI